ncbi:MAG: mandelate racemase/muconate lactonizing enzyme family protein [Chloroflexi bacterium]|nr:mandelate racemase/muconate lactonizing enzyme family protein [Chloroflexota bacterium]
MRVETVEGMLIGSDLLGANYVVRITTDTGITGVGQSGAWGFPDATQKIVEQYAEWLVGQDPLRIEHIQQYLYRMRPFRGNLVSGALSAIDIALWDIKGKHYGAPVWDLLGGRVRDKVRLHLLLEGSDPDSIRANAKIAAEEGFTALKYDPLQAGYQDQTLARLIEGARDMAAAAREVVGLDVDLIFELHRKLTPMQGLAVAEALAEFRPLFIEDPIQIDSVMLQGELAKRFSFPLANGERMNTIWEFRDLLAAGGPQYVRPDLGVAGGITQVKKIAAIAESYHSALVTHNFQGPLITAAAVHVDVSIPNFITQEYLQLDESPRPADAVFRTACKRVGGYIPAPEAPGIGVTLDEELLGKASPKYMPTASVVRVDGSPGFAV